MFRRGDISGIMVHRARWVLNFVIFKDKQEYGYFGCHWCSDYSSAYSGGPCRCSEEGTLPELWSTGHDGYQISWFAKPNKNMHILGTIGTLPELWSTGNDGYQII